MPQLQILDFGNTNRTDSFIDQMLKQAQLIHQMNTDEATIAHQKWTEGFQSQQAEKEQQRFEADQTFKQKALEQDREKYEYGKAKDIKDDEYKAAVLSLDTSKYQEDVRSHLVQENLGYGQLRIGEKNAETAAQNSAISKRQQTLNELQWVADASRRAAEVSQMETTAKKAALELDAMEAIAGPRSENNLLAEELRAEELNSQIATLKATNMMTFMESLSKNPESIKLMAKAVKKDPTFIQDPIVRDLILDLDENPDYATNPQLAIKALATDPNDKVALSGVIAGSVTDAYSMYKLALKNGDFTKPFEWYKQQAADAAFQLVDALAIGEAEKKEMKERVGKDLGVTIPSVYSKGGKSNVTFGKLGELTSNKDLKRPNKVQRSTAEFIAGSATGESAFLHTLDAMEQNYEFQYYTDDPLVKALIDQKQPYIEQISVEKIGRVRYDEIKAKVKQDGRSIWEVNLIRSALVDIRDIISTPLPDSKMATRKDAVERYLFNWENSTGLSLNTDERVQIKEWLDARVKRDQKNNNYMFFADSPKI